MHLLPAYLGRIADLAEDCTGKFALGHVRLRLGPDNTFSAEASDTKVLLRVAGPCVAPATDFPDAAVPGLDTAPNGHAEALVPAAAWKKSFTQARKLTAKSRTDCLRSLAVKIGERVTTFSAYDPVGQKPQCDTVENGTGRWMPTDEVLKKSESEFRRDAVFVDPKALAELLRVVAEVVCDDEHVRVQLVTHGTARPLQVKAENPRTGVTASAVLQPLYDEDLAKAQGAEDELRRSKKMKAALAGGALELQNQLDAVTAERDALQEECRRLDAKEGAAREELAQLRIELARLKQAIAMGEPVAAAPLTRAERLLALKGEAK